MGLKKEFAHMRDEASFGRQRTFEYHGSNNDHAHRKREIDYLDLIELLQEHVDSNNDTMDEQENDIKVLQHELGISTKTLAETVANLKLRRRI